MYRGAVARPAKVPGRAAVISPAPNGLPFDYAGMYFLFPQGLREASQSEKVASTAPVL